MMLAYFWHSLGVTRAIIWHPLRIKKEENLEKEEYFKNKDTLKNKSHIKKCRKAEYVQRRVRFVNVQSSLHENVVFSVSFIFEVVLIF